MGNTNIEILSILRYYLNPGLKSTETVCNTHEVEGQNQIILSVQLKVDLNGLRKETLILQIKSRCGRTSVVNPVELKNVETNPTTNTLSFRTKWDTPRTTYVELSWKSVGC